MVIKKKAAIKKKVAKKVDKKLVKKFSRKVKKVKVARAVKNPWFKTIDQKHSWGFVPINWKGGGALVLLIGINVFASKYFNLNYLTFDNWSSFTIVFLLSMAIFVIISKRKTIKNS